MIRKAEKRVLWMSDDGCMCMQDMMEQRNATRQRYSVECNREQLIIDYGLSVLLVWRVSIVLHMLMRHVHVTGVAIRVGIIVRLLVWCVRHRRRVHRRTLLLLLLRFRTVFGSPLGAYLDLGGTFSQARRPTSVFRGLYVPRVRWCSDLDTTVLACGSKDGNAGSWINEPGRQCSWMRHVLLRGMVHVTRNEGNAR